MTALRRHWGAAAFGGMSMRRLGLSGCVLAAVGWSGGAIAQVPTADDASAEVVVTGQRAQQERAIQAKRDAIGVVDVASADEIGRLPDRNVAEVVERLPGVGVTYDQGEGRFVAVRGVPSALNGYTLNGLEIGNPDGNTRALPLDVVSGQLINRVEVSKVKTADMDGQGIGGQINLVTQTAFDFRDPLAVSANVKAGRQAFNDKVPVQADLSVAARFGADQQFGIALGGSYSHRDFNSQGFYPDNWKPNAAARRGGVPDNIKYTEYSLDRERYGGTASLDWRPTATQQFYVRSVYSKFIEDEIRPRYRLDFTLTPFTFNADGLTGTTPGVASSQTGVAGSGPERRVDLRLNYKTKSILSVMGGGKTELDRLTLDYAVSYSRNEVLDAFPIWQFRCNPGAVAFDFSEKLYTAVPLAECTPNQLQFRQYTNSRQEGREDIWQGRFDATYDLGGDSILKYGFKYRETDKAVDQRNDVWDRGATAATRFTLGQFSLQGPNLTVYPDDRNPDRGYANAPTIDPAAITAFTAANLSGPLFVFNTATSLANATLGDFDLTERVAAAYAMANLRFGVVTVTPGLRYEHTRLDNRGFQLRAGAVTPVARSNRYDDVLPSLIVRVKPDSRTVFRLAYSHTLGRPDYASLTPGGSVNIADNTASFGNPDLKPYRADNYDATAEWYFARGGLIAVGVFAKDIRNPVFSRATVLTNTTLNGIFYPVLTLSQPFNADRGDIVGIELQFEQQFRFLPGFLSGFGIQLTGTLTDSTLRLPSGRTSTFPSQSKYLYGAELFYQRGALEASIAYHNTGRALLAIGEPAFNDQFNDDLRRLDAKVSVGIRPGIRLFAEAQNLTDEPTRQYQAGNRDWVIQNERYGRTFYAGVSAKF